MTQETTNALSAIAAAYQATKNTVPPIRDMWFNGKVINLDGYVFENCRFDKCTLQISSLTFKLSHCWISKDCPVIFLGRTLTVIQLYLNQFVLDKNQFGALLPELHADGTVSIG